MATPRLVSENRGWRTWHTVKIVYPMKSIWISIAYLKFWRRYNAPIGILSAVSYPLSALLDAFPLSFFFCEWSMELCGLGSCFWRGIDSNFFVCGHHRLVQGERLLQSAEVKRSTFLHADFLSILWQKWSEMRFSDLIDKLSRLSGISMTFACIFILHLRHSIQLLNSSTDVRQNLVENICF